jgi:ABC transport system ATP-binding/permease protein
MNDVAPVLSCRGLGLAVPGRTLCRDVAFDVHPGDVWVVVGRNGAGKTTLLRMLLGELKPDEGEVRLGANVQIAYYDQQREQLDPERTVFDTVGEGNDTVTSNGRTRHVHAYLRDFLFSDERARSPVKALSGGERNRLLLARLFTRPANVLVLDEPTNDLDLETLELLEEQLVEWPGTLLLVSHDRAFLDNVVTSTFVFEGDGRVREYVGGYEDWVRQRLAENTSKMIGGGSVKEGTRAAPDEKPKTTKIVARRMKLSFKDQRELDGLPAAIDALEQEQRAVAERIAAPDFYKESAEGIRQTLARAEELQRELAAAYARWGELDAIKTNG